VTDCLEDFTVKKCELVIDLPPFIILFNKANNFEGDSKVEDI